MYLLIYSSHTKWPGELWWLMKWVMDKRKRRQRSSLEMGACRFKSSRTTPFESRIMWFTNIVYMDTVNIQLTSSQQWKECCRPISWDSTTIILKWIETRNTEYVTKADMWWDLESLKQALKSAKLSISKHSVLFLYRKTEWKWRFGGNF